MAKKNVSPKNPQSDETKADGNEPAAAETVTGKVKSRKSGRKTGAMHWSDRDLKGNVVPVAW